MIVGEIVTVAKLFSRAHTKGKDKIFADDRSKAVWEKYQSLKMAKEVPPSEEDDSLFLEAVGGWNEKGTVYGLIVPVFSTRSQCITSLPRCLLTLPPSSPSFKVN